MSSAPAPRPSRKQLRAYIILNLFGTPGLGSFLAGWRWSGAAQMLVAITGFSFIVVWFFQVGLFTYRLVSGAALETDAPSGRAGWIGLGIFMTAWIWSAITSFFLARSVPPEPPAYYK